MTLMSYKRSSMPSIGILFDIRIVRGLVRLYSIKTHLCPNTTTDGQEAETMEITQPQEHKCVVYSTWEVSKKFV